MRSLPCFTTLVVLLLAAAVEARWLGARTPLLVVHSDCGEPWNAFMSRAVDFGCKDVKLLLNTLPPVPLAPPTPTVTTPPKLVRCSSNPEAKA